MKSIILVALALVAVAVALPVELPKTIRSEYEQQPQGSYTYDFETDDGTKQKQEGQLKEVLNEENKPQLTITVRGSYTYTNPDGVVETVNYVADENGYRADGPSIPKAARR